MKYVKNFSEWAKEWYQKFLDVHEDILGDYNSISGYSIVYDLAEGKSAMSKCGTNEDFDSSIGIGVAYARLCGEEIPKEMKTTLIRKLTCGDKFLIQSRIKEKEDKIWIFVCVHPINDTALYTDEEGKNLAELNKNTKVYKVE